MTIRELIDALGEFPDDMEVEVQYRDWQGDWTGTDEPRVVEDDGKVIL